MDRPTHGASHSLFAELLLSAQRRKHSLPDSDSNSINELTAESLQTQESNTLLTEPTVPSTQTEPILLVNLFDSAPEPLLSPIDLSRAVFPMPTTEFTPEEPIQDNATKLHVGASNEQTKVDLNMTDAPLHNILQPPQDAFNMDPWATPTVNSSETTERTTHEEIPTIIHRMLDDVRIDIARFYIPLEHITRHFLRHIQQSLASNQHSHQGLPLMQFLSCLMGVETILSWLGRYMQTTVQSWVREAILSRRKDNQGPTGPLLITAANITRVILAVREHTRSSFDDFQSPEECAFPPKSPPRSRKVTTKNSRPKATTTELSAATLSLQSPTRRGLHVLMSEHIYRHDYRSISKHIPQFSTKKSAIEISAASARRKRGLNYGNLKRKTTKPASP
ncbi:hypothetical protein Ae201684P_008427 [Aphanomyces euteiches]|uniref:Uncharacterized protein n=1 Tax=Aphanomyces euteiches TaxID=100861 RepID=A0A6G0XPF6_9STRA|nr:hypothetical protein Ae201684_002815 [Aphanomyces euteiches]KAH9092758.1 hypothetical protein Ae201684P_008427 [Aphanomyces euteiches]